MPRSHPPAEPVTVEVEVVEIDGVTHAPPPEKPAPAPRPGPQGWAQWSGRIRRLDARWWPLWVVLGVIGVFLALTVGVVLAAIYLVFRIVFGILRWIAAFLTGSSGGAVTRR
jgi:hypothetical protein